MDNEELHFKSRNMIKYFKVEFIIGDMTNLKIDKLYEISEGYDYDTYSNRLDTTAIENRDTLLSTDNEKFTAFVSCSFIIDYNNINQKYSKIF